jgi:hypothetical protein
VTSIYILAWNDSVAKICCAFNYKSLFIDVTPHKAYQYTIFVD